MFPRGKLLGERELELSDGSRTISPFVRSTRSYSGLPFVRARGFHPNLWHGRFHPRYDIAVLKTQQLSRGIFVAIDLAGCRNCRRSVAPTSIRQYSVAWRGVLSNLNLRTGSPWSALIPIAAPPAQIFIARQRYGVKPPGRRKTGIIVLALFLHSFELRSSEIETWQVEECLATSLKTRALAAVHMLNGGQASSLATPWSLSGI